MSMMIVAELCTSCGDCEPDCPTVAIKPKKGVYWIDPEKCTECDGDADAPKCETICDVDDCIVPLEA